MSLATKSNAKTNRLKIMLVYNMNENENYDINTMSVMKLKKFKG